MTNVALTLDQALAVILAHLRTHGRATNSDLRDLLGGDDALFARARERLILDDLAQDKGGVALIYAGPALPPAQTVSAAAKPGTAHQPRTPPRLFLSYARADDEAFVRRLYGDLTSHGFPTWFDRVSLPSMQLTFHQEIVDAIRKDVDRLIYVAGPRAATSDYVRQEWRSALELDRPVIPILRLGDYKEVPGELSLLHCDDFRDDGLYATQLEKLIANLNRPEPPLGALFGVPTLPANFMTRPELLHRMRDALLVDLQKPVVVSGATGVGTQVGLQGMGGIGKSVLAAAVARDRQLRRAYPDGVVWVTVGQQPNLTQLQLDVARHMGGTESFTSVEQGKRVLARLLAEKALMLVLDDVWDARAAGAFSVLGPRGRVLVTTRDAGVIDALHGERIPVSLFTEHEAMQLLADTSAGVGKESVAVSSLPDEAREVVRQCGFLPLGVALCGGMARAGASWGEILAALKQADLEEIGQRQMRDGDNPQHRTLWAAMLASVEHLGDAEKKRRFAELSVFATDRTVPEAAVATLWGYTGKLAGLAVGNLLREFSERSLIQLEQPRDASGSTTERRISLHDLLHDCASRLAGDPIVLHGAMLGAYEVHCTAGWASGPNDGYFFQELVRHVLLAGRREDAEALLLERGWMVAKLEACGVNALLADFEMLKLEGSEAAADERVSAKLRQVERAVRQEAHWLGRMGEAGLPICFDDIMYNRLLSNTGREPTELLPGLNPRLGLRHPVNMGDEAQVLVGHENGVTACAITPDGKRIVSASVDKTLRVWDLESGSELRVLRGHEIHAEACAITPDGKRIVSASYDKTLRAWDLESGTELRVLRGHENSVYACAIAPNGKRIVSASWDKTLRAWDLESGTELRVLRGHEEWVLACAITPDGKRIVSASWDKTLRVWDLESGTELRVLRGHEDAVTACAITPDGKRIVSASKDSTLRVWDLESGSELRLTRRAATSDLRGLAFLRSHGNVGKACAITPDGKRIVSASDDKTLGVWDLESGTERRVLRGHDRWVLACAITPDSKRIVSASIDKTLRVWDLESATELCRFRGHEGWVLACAITPDGKRVVSASADRTLRVWDLESGTERHVLRGHESAVNACAVTSDGKRIVSASNDKTLRVWDLESGTELRVLHGHEEWVGACAITLDGKRIVSASADKTLRVWDLEFGTELRVLRGHEGWVLACAVTPDGKRAVSASNDKTLRVWDLESGTELRVLRGHEGGVAACAITADGERIVSASADKTLRVWDLESGTCVHVICGVSSFKTTTVSSTALAANDASGNVWMCRLTPNTMPAASPLQ